MAIGFTFQPDHPGVTYTSTFWERPGNIQTFTRYKTKDDIAKYAAQANLVAVNCNLYVAKLGTENETIWQWGSELTNFNWTGSFSSGHPQANAAMWVVPIEMKK